MASLALDGPMATPTVNYVVRAAAIGFGDTVVEDVYASGLARVDADRILIPIDARARRVSGLNAAAGGLLTNVRSEEHTSELQSLMRISYAVFRLQKKTDLTQQPNARSTSTILNKPE